jgi:hypothetical protein
LLCTLCYQIALMSTIVNWTVFILFKSSGISDDESSTNLNLETTGTGKWK